jgi:AcrR family transcriptional regulator
MSTTHPTRRTPVQGRSQETVQKVLAATADLLASGQPVELLTTAAIAAAASVSVGALYRFFPDKQAIVDAIALDHMEKFQEAVAMRLMLSFPPDPTAFLSTILDAFAEYLEAHPDFRTVAFGAPGGARYISRPTRDAYAGSGEVSEMIRSFLSEAYNIAITDTFELRLRLAIEIGDRLFAYAFEPRPPEARAAIIAEAKRILASTLFGS